MNGSYRVDYCFMKIKGAGTPKRDNTSEVKILI
jgi:hypothetical protein